MNLDHVFIDLETTGINPRIDSIIEIAAIRTSATGEILCATCDKVRPTTKVSAEAQAVNHYSEDAWENAVDLKAAIRGMTSVICEGRSDKLVVVAHGAPFDSAMLAMSCEREGIAVPFQGRKWVDTVTLAWPLIFSGRVMSASLSSLCKFYGIENSGAHTAAGDADACRQVYWQLIRRYETAQRVEQTIDNAINNATGQTINKIVNFISAFKS